MLAQAVELLEGASRLHRQFFHIGQARQTPRWEPPIDMYGDALGVRVLVALPGVAPHHLEVMLEPQAVVVRGERTLGAVLDDGSILQLEIPYGSFERRINLPPGDYRIVEMQLEYGCLRLLLERLP